MAATFDTIPIRYDGKDAAEHYIELNSLAESLQGMARVLAVTSNFVVTQKYVKQYQAQDVRVLVGEPKANCFTLHAVVQFAEQQQLFAGAGGAAIATILTWVFGRAANRREEMKALKDSLDKAIASLASNNQQTIEALTMAVERMAEGLRPAVRQAVQPVGVTCEKMTVAGTVVIDEAMATAIRNNADEEVTAEKTWQLRITELDLESQSAKVRLEGDKDVERRIKAKITDPAIATLSSPYALALLNQTVLRVRGKATLREGELTQLFISNTTD